MEGQIMKDIETCPLCSSDQRGTPIPQASIEAGYYGDSTHFCRSIMVEIPGVYDGGLFWMCPDCGGAWHRWEPESRLGLRAQTHIDKQNAYIALTAEERSAMMSA